MITLLQAGLRVQQLLERQGWSFCFIGGIANFRWGTPRLTNDLDLTILTGFGAEASFVAELLRAFKGRIPDVADFAARNRVVLLETVEGFGVDVALGAMPFEEAAVARSSKGELAPGVSLRTCSADDLIVHKAFAARPQDWVDVEGIILKQRGQLDWPLIWSNLGELAELKEEPGLIDELRAIARRTQTVLGPFPL